ncbi:MAG TPA: hypothetical protein VLB69_14990 [Rudaea sp.]|nr:hypothetical protein [Rudaea sp.]
MNDATVGDITPYVGARHVPKGRRPVLRYVDGIDSIASTDHEDPARATPFVPQVLAELKDGRAVTVTTSQPCGCSVKYGS